VSGDLRFKPHLFLPFVSRLVRHPAILNAVEAVLGTENILLWSSDFNIKPVGSGGYFSAHQDATFTGLAPAERGVTVWLALSEPVDERHGCMVFWPKTHQLGQLPHIEEPHADVNNMLSRGQRIDEKALGPDHGRRKFVAELRGGEASLHHFHLVHRSAPNLGNTDRVGLAMRFIAADVRQKGHARECVTLVRGMMQHDGFDLEPELSPNASTEEVEAGLRAHAEAMRRETANYFNSAEGVKAYDDDRI
jgi:ectoine hydroxylase-related dioxygenase (phytanoyl-CoA dioxygenase family)